MVFKYFDIRGIISSEMLDIDVISWIIIFSDDRNSKKGIWVI